MDPKVRPTASLRETENGVPLPAGTDQELTDRETDVYRLLALGQNSKQVGVTLGISPKTVDNHRARIMEKLGFESIAELVRVAIRTGVIEP